MQNQIGGPLMYNVRLSLGRTSVSRYYQCGIQSYDVTDCGRTDKPTVYTRVQTFVD